MIRRLGALMALVLVPTLAVGNATSPSHAASGAAPSHTAPSHAASAASAATRPAVIGYRVIGHSVQGRPIKAWHLGQPHLRGVRTVVLMATMHGNERRVHLILDSLRDGAPIKGVNMWVIPIANPDGYAHNTRKNARGVDLNRNFPRGWVHTTGHYASGPRPASEPETRALMAFLAKVHPWRILSFHQPLHAVDTDNKVPAYSRRVARVLGLPATHVTCAGVCGGTMTQWYNHRFAGAGITVEYGTTPPLHRMRVEAPRELLRLFGAHR